MDVEPDHLRDVEQFDDVYPSSAALHRGDDGLIAVETFGEVGLAEACTFALLDKQVDQADVSRGAQGLGPSPVSELLRPTDRVSAVSGYRKIWLC